MSNARRNPVRRLVLLLVFLLATPAYGEAQSAAHDSATPIARHPLRRYSLTFSPIYLVVPIGLVTGEVRVREKFGFALKAGGGWLTQDSPGIKTHVRVLELGAQARYYALGDFRHGLQVGAEALYLHLESPFKMQFPIAGEGFALGPFVGYKYTMDVGFTFDAQVGYQYLWAKGADSETSTGSTRTGESMLLLNINVGWSF